MTARRLGPGVLALLAVLASLAVVLGMGTGRANAVVNVNMSSYGATCNGTHDDKPALEAALAAVQNAGGGSVTVPAGNCRIVQTAASIATGIEGPVTIKGSSTTASASKLSLDTDVVGDYRELFRVFGSNVKLQNLTLSRARNLFGIMLNVWGTSGFGLTNVVVDGRQNTINGADVDGIELSAPTGDTISNMSISGSTFKNLTFGLFQASGTGGTVNGVSVDGSTFTGNFLDDLEFNAPGSSMSNINVTNSHFSNNLYTDLSHFAGFGVGFANVQTGKIQNNTFTGYTFEPVHVEDRSSHITIDHNQFSNSFTGNLDFASMVFIINDSHYVDVTNNTFDTSANNNPIACVYASSGGGTAPPSNITVTGNTFKLRPNAQAVAQNDATAVTVSGNTTVNLP